MNPLLALEVLKLSLQLAVMTLESMTPAQRQALVTQQINDAALLRGWFEQLFEMLKPS